MNAHPLAAITAAEVDAFLRAGVICLRGLFDAEWVEQMRAAVEDDLAHPGPAGARVRDPERPALPR